MDNIPPTSKVAVLMLGSSCGDRLAIFRETTTALSPQLSSLWDAEVLIRRQTPHKILICLNSGGPRKHILRRVSRQLAVLCSSTDQCRKPREDRSRQPAAASLRLCSASFGSSSSRFNTTSSSTSTKC